MTRSNMATRESTGPFRRLRGGLLLQFTTLSLVCTVLSATLVSWYLTTQLDGHTALLQQHGMAMMAGIDFSRGEILLPIDADLQNDPADIPALLKQLEAGYDVVSGWRKDRKDRGITRRLPSVCANWVISRVSGLRLHDYGCTLKAYRREVM